MIKGYLAEIETLRAQLLESESICSQLRKSLSRKAILSPRHDSFSDPNIESLLDLAKKDVEKDLEAIARLQMNMENQSDQSDSESGESLINRIKHTFSSVNCLAFLFSSKKLKYN